MHFTIYFSRALGLQFGTRILGITIITCFLHCFKRKKSLNCTHEKMISFLRCLSQLACPLVFLSSFLLFSFSLLSLPSFPPSHTLSNHQSIFFWSISSSYKCRAIKKERSLLQQPNAEKFCLFGVTRRKA